MSVSNRGIPRRLGEVDFPVKAPGRPRWLLRDQQLQFLIEDKGVISGIAELLADGNVSFYDSWHDIRDYHEYQFESRGKKRPPEGVGVSGGLASPAWKEEGAGGS